MSRRLLVVAAGLSAAVVLLALLPVGVAVSQEFMEVFVTNWPHVQEVEGTVSVKGPIRNAALTRIEDITVPPVKRSDTTRLIDAGTLVTDGYSYLVLSLTGDIKGAVLKPGAVGAILIPEEETIERAFKERGRFMFPLEVKSEEIAQSNSYFYSGQPRFALGFPEYRVLLYNNSDKTVEVDLFAYLTN